MGRRKIVDVKPDIFVPAVLDQIFVYTLNQLKLVMKMKVLMLRTFDLVLAHVNVRRRLDYIACEVVDHFECIRESFMRARKKENDC